MDKVADLLRALRGDKEGGKDLDRNKLDVRAICPIREFGAFDVRWWIG